MLELEIVKLVAEILLALFGVLFAVLKLSTREKKDCCKCCTTKED